MDDAGSSPVTGTRESWNAYMRTYLRKRYAERSAHFTNELGGVCVECGSVEDLQFDHIDRATKSFEVRYLLYKRRLDDQELLTELAKCQLLCKVCHEKKTAIESSVGHGGGLTGVRNCRCEACGPLKNAYMSARVSDYNGQRCRRKQCPGDCGKSKHY